MSGEGGNLNTDWGTMDMRIEGRLGRYVICPNCKAHGSLILKPKKTNGKVYKYYYVEHSIGKKKKWCRVGKFENLPDDFKRMVKPQP